MLLNIIFFNLHSIYYLLLLFTVYLHFQGFKFYNSNRYWILFDNSLIQRFKFFSDQITHVIYTYFYTPN